MKDEIKEIKDNLKINKYLDLIKEDKNLSMGYVSLAQYIYKLENKITNLQEENERLKDFNDTNIDRNIEAYKIVEKQEKEITNLEQKIDKMLVTLKEEVSYLMPYEIYRDEVDSIVEKIEKIANGGDE